jgi:hypothetical protein
MTRSRDSAVRTDVSRYPAHVPTISEQLEGSAWEPDEELTVRRVENMTALGVLSNPLTYRSRLEPMYDPGSSPAERTAEHSDEDGVTAAHRKGEDHQDTSYPSAARLE